MVPLSVFVFVWSITNCSHESGVFARNITWFASLVDLIVFYEKNRRTSQESELKITVLWPKQHACLTCNSFGPLVNYLPWNMRLPSRARFYFPLCFTAKLRRRPRGQLVKVWVPIDKTNIKERAICWNIRWIRNNVLQSVDNAWETSASMKNLTLIQNIEWHTLRNWTLNSAFQRGIRS